MSYVDGVHATPLGSGDARRLAGRDLTEHTYTCMERKERIMETTQGKGETGLLTPLFEAQFQYQSDMIASETHDQERSPRRMTCLQQGDKHYDDLTTRTV